jgi:hypothetical protein
MPKPLKGRAVMVVADEDVAKLWPAPLSFAWVYDITTETLPVSISKRSRCWDLMLMAVRSRR